MEKDRTWTWICSKCFNEETGPLGFATFELYQAHNKKFHSESEEKLVDRRSKEEKPVNVPLRTPKPSIQERAKIKLDEIKLTYKYVGICPNCNGEVDTIELPVYDKSIVIAYCMGEKKVITRQEVIPIENQEELCRSKRETKIQTGESLSQKKQKKN